jgi:hypothetical protein
MKTTPYNAATVRLFPDRVYVREYVRYRLGQLERVRSHTRQWPGGEQLMLLLH